MMHGCNNTAEGNAVGIQVLFVHLLLEKIQLEISMGKSSEHTEQKHYHEQKVVKWTSWWFQPIWKILVNLDHSARQGKTMKPPPRDTSSNQNLRKLFCHSGSTCAVPYWKNTAEKCSINKAMLNFTGVLKKTSYNWYPVNRKVFLTYSIFWLFLWFPRTRTSALVRQKLLGNLVTQGWLYHP